jgi:hypothetical protein
VQGWGENIWRRSRTSTSRLRHVVANEAAASGYEAEDRHFVRAFLGHQAPRLTFDDGVYVVELLMAAYQSVEQERTLAFPPERLEAFVPAVARGAWAQSAPARRGEREVRIALWIATRGFGEAWQRSVFQSSAITSPYTVSPPLYAVATMEIDVESRR